MAGWGRFGAVLAVGVLLGAAGGGYAGMRLGTDTIASRWIATEANRSGEVVGILEHLRAGRRGEALAELETHLNRHVFGLMPSARAGVSLSDNARRQVVAATRRVRAYRERYPHDGQTALDRDVRRYLGGE